MAAGRSAAGRSSVTGWGSLAAGWGCWAAGLSGTGLSGRGAGLSGAGLSGRGAGVEGDGKSGAGVCAGPAARQTAARQPDGG